MKRPLMIFQGEKDTRVRIEHALRMQQLISVYDMKHQVIIFTDEGHSYSQKNTVKLYLENSLKFIKKHLEIN
jgi:dipeptidyl aminopeptidase/acylaminoacyl peptidase